jgi:hypothetical protein
MDHVRRVAKRMKANDEYVVIAAWHDTVEEGSMSREDLCQAGAERGSSKQSLPSLNVTASPPRPSLSVPPPTRWRNG